MLENTIYNTNAPPAAAEHLLKRPMVEKSLKDAFKKPLTTVIASAGYGKTQAVLAALSSMKCKSTWVQLSKLDNHVDGFWERIAYALKPHSQYLFESLISLGYPESIAAFDQFLRLLVKELTQNGLFVFVFDDLHLIDNKTVLNFFELFISSGIQNFSIVVISRRKPALSLTGMLSKGLLARITEDDLRFSEDEVGAYFREQGISFNENTISNIYAYTNGWIFAIYLVGLAAQKGTVNNQNPISTAKIDIYDLIENEIFNMASQELQELLIKLSILDAIPSGLLKEIVQDDPSLLSEMMQLSLFIAYDPFLDIYRIHHLFKEFLQERKNRLKKDEFLNINLTAAKWYEKSNRKSEAIIHYKECGHYHEIFNIILSYTHHVAKETADLFIDLITQASDEMINTRPIMRVAKAKFMFNNNRINEAQRELSIIRKEFEALPTTKENQTILGEAYIILALISIINSDYEFEALFKTADEYLPDGSILWDHKTNIAEGVNVCAIKDHSAGALKRNQEALFNAAPRASRVLNGCGYGLEYLNAAESSLYTGDLKSAEKYAYKTIYNSRQYLQYDVEYMANLVLVRIFTAKGNYQKMSEIFNQMQSQLTTLQISDCITLYDVIKGWFYVKIGKTKKVAKWIKYEEETRKMLAPVILGREYLVRSDCLLAEERYYELLAFMDQTDKIYEDRGILFAVVQNKITKAIIYHYTGDHIKSVKMLREAYELTYPNNLIMQYIEYGNSMRTLIHTVRQDKECNIPKEWLDKIYTKSSTYAKQLSQAASAYNIAHASENVNQLKLSKRESEVLVCISRGMTREEIANHLYLALSTVNSIIKSVYNKLGASNIADAVRIATEKHIL